MEQTGKKGELLAAFRKAKPFSTFVSDEADPMAMIEIVDGNVIEVNEISGEVLTVSNDLAKQAETLSTVLNS